MTGQKAPIQVMNKLGNCYSYEIVLKVETAQAELSKELSQQKNPLPLKPDQLGKHVLTYFGWTILILRKKI